MHNLRLHLASGSPLLLGLNGGWQPCSNKLWVQNPILQRLRWTQVISIRRRERVRDGARFKRPSALIIANGQAEEPQEGDGTGDKKVQDLLVGIVRLQTGKLRVNELVDERSKLLSDIAKQAKDEYDKIAEDAMRTMDEASSKVLKNVEEDAQALEDELASARAEIEASDRNLTDFEENVDRARSEGLFFKGLYSKPLKAWKDQTLEEQNLIKEKAEMVSNVAKKSAVSQSRRFLYGVLIFLLSLTLVESISSRDVQWPKLALYFLVLVALVVQLSYEKFVASDGDDLKR